jgi:outer membrane protein insertion porin family
MIIRHFIKLAFFLFYLNISVLSQTQFISSFEVVGNNNFTQKDYMEWSGLKINQPLSEAISDSISLRILRALSLNGYFFARIDSISFIQVDSLNTKILVAVDEDSPTIISSIVYLNTDSTDKTYLEEKFQLIIGQQLNKFDFETIIQSILNHYENIGYPFIKIIIQSVYFESDSLNLLRRANIALKLDKGVLSKIDLVEISGNESTKDYVIIRELRLSSGSLYSQNKIEQLPQRLNKLRFFEPVKTPTFYINKKDQGVLLIEVKEKQTNNFDGIIGYIPPGKNEEKGFITGFVNISLRNLFGTGRAAALKWNKFSKNSQELDLKYLEPWIFNFPINISLNLYQRIQDTTYVQRKVEGSLEYLATETISASFIAGTESVIPTESTLSVFTVYNSSLITTGLNFKLDTRNDPYSPTSGILFSNTYFFSQKKITGPSQFITPSTETKINLQKIFSDFEIYYSFFNRQVAAFAFHARELRGKSFDNSDLFKFGGSNTIRGYREEQFFGNRLLWSNIEYRFLLTPQTFVFAFYDLGYYLRQADSLRGIQKNQMLLYGYGIGLNIETALGVLVVSFALGKDDSFSEGKIHFGLVNQF